ncbi:hypothetical protein GXW82_03280 [Streptacidiphilus sp. 4-A2]|nr:hypothetical protein [Streptacidiphilus sp. 4-A2]
MAALAETLALEGARLTEVLPALASWRRRERGRSLTADWRYRISWVPVADRRPAALSGTWLVVTGPAGADTAAACARALTGHGAATVLAEVSGRTRPTGALAERIGAAAPGRAWPGCCRCCLEQTRCRAVRRCRRPAATVALLQALGELPTAAAVDAHSGAVVPTGPRPPGTGPGVGPGPGRRAGTPGPLGRPGPTCRAAPRDPGGRCRGAVVRGTGVGSGGEDQVALRDTGVWPAAGAAPGRAPGAAGRRAAACW